MRHSTTWIFVAVILGSSAMVNAMAPATNTDLNSAKGLCYCCDYYYPMCTASVREMYCPDAVLMPGSEIGELWCPPDAAGDSCSEITSGPDHNVANSPGGWGAM